MGAGRDKRSDPPGGGRWKAVDSGSAGSVVKQEFKFKGSTEELVATYRELTAGKTADE